VEIIGTCITCISTANVALTLGIALIGLAVAIFRDVAFAGR
jgi:hypothetical protein